MKSSRNFRTQIFILLVLQLKNALSQDQNALQYLIEQTNYLIYNSSSIIEDTTSFFPSYDFIVVIKSFSYTRWYLQDRYNLHFVDFQGFW